MKRFALAMIVAALAVGLSSCGFRHKKYDNPITADTDQPDKRLFDSAIKDLEKGKYEIARLQLNTLINTYESSEFLAKAKLAMADAWMREGGARGLGQAEAEYKDFILFYPTMEEAAESQYKICDIHYKQMEKPDRDPNQSLRAEQECRQVLVAFPNSVFTERAEQRVREVQEVLAESEYRVGDFYYKRGSINAAAGRLGGVADQYPLFSKADEALWLEGQAYKRLGANFRNQEGDSLTRIVRDYPLSKWVPDATARLRELEMPVPEPDSYAMERMKWELENRQKPGMLSRTFGFMRRGPATWTAAKTGAPQMQPPPQSIPPLVPAAGNGAAGGFQGNVTVQPVTDSSALDRNPDARPQQPQQQPQQQR